MPDGDRIYNRPAGKGLNQAYDMLVEGQSLSDIAYRIQTALAALLRKYGNEPRLIIEQTIQALAEIRGELGAGRDLPLEATSQKITELAEQILGHRRGMPLAIDACKAFLLDLVPDHSSAEMRRNVVQGYIWRIYNADFAERLPLYFHDGKSPVSQEEVDTRLGQLRNEMQPYIATFAERFMEVSDVKKIKRVSRAKDVKQFDNDSDDDIYAGEM